MRMRMIPMSMKITTMLVMLLSVLFAMAAAALIMLMIVTTMMDDAGDIHDHRGLRERRWQRPRCRHLDEDGGMVADDDGDGADYDDPRKSRDRCRD